MVRLRVDQGVEQRVVRGKYGSYIGAMAHLEVGLMELYKNIAGLGGDVGLLYGQSRI